MQLSNNNEKKTNLNYGKNWLRLATETEALELPGTINEITICISETKRGVASVAALQAWDTRGPFPSIMAWLGAWCLSYLLAQVIRL